MALDEELRRMFGSWVVDEDDGDGRASGQVAWHAAPGVWSSWR